VKYLVLIASNYGVIVGRSKVNHYVLNSKQEIEDLINSIKKRNGQITFLKVIEGTQIPVDVSESIVSSQESILKC
jgi:hypothetical protein